jgi:hypothetical protein
MKVILNKRLSLDTPYLGSVPQMETPQTVKLDLELSDSLEDETQDQNLSEDYQNNILAVREKILQKLHGSKNLNARNLRQEFDSLEENSNQQFIFVS